MALRLRPLAKSGLFLARNHCTNEHVSARNASAKRSGKVAQCEKTGKKEAPFIDGIVNGERVLIARPKRSEKAIEIEIRTALAAAHVMVMKHHIDRRSPFGAGLGLGVPDLICIVPPYGRFLAIEVKKPGFSPSDVREEQQRWHAIARRYNAVVGIATNVEEAFVLVDMARKLP